MVQDTPLKDRIIFLCTPLGEGGSKGNYNQFMVRWEALMMRLGIRHGTFFMEKESLLPRARNRMAHHFLYGTPATDFVQIDADIGIQPEDLLSMLLWNKPVIAAPCPRKQILWENVKFAVLKNPQITSQEMEAVSGGMCFNLIGEKGEVAEVDFSQPNPVMEAGTGVMIIQRPVLEQFRDAHPELQYRPTPEEDYGQGKMITGFFMIGIDPESKVLLSEDYWFCREWRKLGGEVWLCPWIKTTHTGMYTYRGNFTEQDDYLGADTRVELLPDPMGITVVD